ncbi:MAG: hypothetical protein HSCHL_1281 [Hydrogenibacillus schlegelii]|uniref:Uncharacterized protein n=1 Tax=Hydrogenibacillus schlegelii TaxID=1484 RepID=A0A2T5G5Y0_HYDSH|nr:hypothetical protein [Hydrogenibacillus schlegelii]PTQ51578.1 MAG: hypothetical protein HSCHL_1281 [Hydrogenibacillus schlegelii]
MKRLLALLLAALFFLSEVALAAGGTFKEVVDPGLLGFTDTLNRDVSEITYGRINNYFTPKNTSNDVLRLGTLFPYLPEFEDYFRYAVWGPWHTDPRWDGTGGIKYDVLGHPRARYIGFGKYGESIGNVFYPPDYNGNNRPYPLENFISEPRKNKAVKDAFPQFFSNYQNYINGVYIKKGMPDDLKKRIRTGYYISASANGYDPYSIIEKTKAPAFEDPAPYVHIVLPPTNETMGSGLVFHKGRDGRIYYMSVPIPPEPLLLDGEDWIEITPKEQTGQTGTPVQFELKVRWERIENIQKLAGMFGLDFGFQVTLAHKTKSGSYPVDFKIDSLTASKLATKSYINLLPATLGGTLPPNGEKATTFTVTVQNAPTEVVAEIFPIWTVKGKKDLLSFFTVDPLYKTAKATVKPFMPDYAVQLTPSERTAKPGDEVNFNLTVSWKDHPAGQGFRVILAYQTPQGKLPVDFTLGGKTATKGRDVSYVSNMTNQLEGSLSGTVRVKAYDKTSTLIAQVIPLDRNGSPLPIQPPYDGDPKDNEAKAVVKPTGVDYAAVPFKEPVKLYIPYGVNNPSFRIIPHFERLDGIPVNVPYTITIRGAFGTVTKQGDNIPNHQSIGVPYPIVNPPLGTYQVTAEIWPVQKDLDVNPANNRTVITVIVEKAPPPEKGPVQRGIHVELGSK